MLKVESSNTSIAILQDEIRRTSEGKYEHRLHAVLLVAQGMSCVKAAELLGDSVRSVEGWVKSFNQRGLEALRDLPIPGRPSRITPELYYGTARHCPIGFLRQRGSRLAQGSVSACSVNWDFVCVNLDPKVQKLMPPRRRNIKKLSEYGVNEYDIWAMDEVLFQQIGSRCRMWTAPENRQPVSIQYPGRKCVGYFGAVRLRDGKFVYCREEDKFNAETSWAFLKKVEEESRCDGKAVMLIIDNAKYHHAKLHQEWREEVCNGFRIEYLPPYSPELNPIERVWRLTRRKRLHNQFFPSLKALMIAVESLFDTWMSGSEDLRRLCRI